MKTITNLGAGGAWLGFWHQIPMGIKVPVIGGLALLGVAELAIDMNHAIQSGRIFEGQGAQSDAQGRQSQAIANAATEKVNDLLAKQAAGTLNATEATQLAQVIASLSEAKSKEAQASAAQAQANAEREAAIWSGNVAKDLNNGDILGAVVHFYGLGSIVSDAKDESSDNAPQVVAPAPSKPKPRRAQTISTQR